MSDEAPVYLSLENLSGGDAIELFNRALQKVLDNILDPKTKPQEKREIKLIVIIKPDETRKQATIEINAMAKLANEEGRNTLAFFRKVGGRAVAVEPTESQMNLPMNVTDIRKPN